MCGGTLVVHPCSHVGHVFRATTPHQWPGGKKMRNVAITRNTLRTVEVWLDRKWRDFYFSLNPCKHNLRQAIMATSVNISGPKRLGRSIPDTSRRGFN